MSESTEGNPGTSDAPLDDAPAAAQSKASRWEDFIDIFYAPSTVYARRADSGFLLPMVVVTVLTGALFLMNSGTLSPIMDAEFSRAMAKQPQQVTAEQLEGLRKM